MAITWDIGINQIHGVAETGSNFTATTGNTGADYSAKPMTNHIRVSTTDLNRVVGKNWSGIVNCRFNDNGENAGYACKYAHHEDGFVVFDRT